MVKKEKKMKKKMKGKGKKKKRASTGGRCRYVSGDHAVMDKK